MNQYQPWSDYELTQLREMAGKYNAREISAATGRGYDGVQKMLRKLGLPTYKQLAKTASVPEPQKPIETPVEKSEPPVRIKTYVAPSVALRQEEDPQRARRGQVVYPPLEYCQNCSSPVSNWAEHVLRMQHMGCKRPAA